MSLLKPTLSVLLMLSVMSIQAEEAKQKSKKEPVQDAPKVQKGNVPQADITITEGADNLLKEYRINGQLRAVKVTPTNGFPAYYLIDREGNGQFIKIGPDMGENIKIPNWILVEW